MVLPTSCKLDYDCNPYSSSVADLEAMMDKSLVPVDQVDERAPGEFVERATGQKVTQIVAKMSKSLRNVINPDDVIAEYGADTFRLYEMYMGPLEASKPWNTRDIVGVFRFLQRAWRLAIDERTGQPLLASEPDPKLERLLHRTIAKVGDDIDRLSFNTAIAALIELVNAATRPTDLADPSKGGLTRDQLDRFLRILWPFAPHAADEIAHRLGLAGDRGLWDASWPAHDPAMLVDDEVEIAVQVLGKVRGRAVVAAGAPQADVVAAARAAVASHLEGKVVVKEIVVPGKLVNFVV